MNTVYQPPGIPPQPSPYLRRRVAVFARLAEEFAAAEGLPPYAA